MSKDRITSQQSSRVSYRKLGLHDVGRLAEHLKRLDPEAKHFRFGTAVSDRFLEEHARKALRWPGIVEGCFVDGELRGTGELQPTLDGLPLEAEAAFAVEKPFRGRGIGTELMRRAIVSAQNRYIETIYTICALENLRMRRLAQKYGAELRIEYNEVAGRLRTPRPTPTSLLQEWAADTRALISSALRQ
ncbi:GNAT family N-acetyltransferase [Rhodoligotrophos defluvii]|uniref:GNAT family N-acetyltransferase n=1 Tax=Rhodoligotrophos defluvii TaxID=2561934 RepID=UPI0010C98D9E|nr:GNAT family N-acetyltransferase [Rhodoligotrophos defluvii]